MEYIGGFRVGSLTPLGNVEVQYPGADVTTALSSLSLNGLKLEIGNVICKQKLEWETVLLLGLRTFTGQNQREEKRWEISEVLQSRISSQFPLSLRLPRTLTEEYPLRHNTCFKVEKSYWEKKCKRITLSPSNGCLVSPEAFSGNLANILHKIPTPQEGKLITVLHLCWWKKLITVAEDVAVCMSLCMRLIMVKL